MIQDLLFRNKFRPYQATAIAMARKYLSEYTSLEEHGCAVVCHPTGSGKTAIIGGITQCVDEIGGALVLTTRKAVRDQLYVELSSNLFVEKFELGDTVELPKVVYPLLSGSDLTRRARSVARSGCEQLLPERLRNYVRRQVDRLVPQGNYCLDELREGRAILVTTVQMLETLRRTPERRDLSKDLGAAIDVALFDEGHYEPARQWSGAVRDLSRPVILFSATPFRNDLRPFVVKKEYFDIYHHRSAIGDGVIRSVRVEKRKKVNTPRDFYRDIVDYCEGAFGARKDWPRVVICCANYVRITEIGEYFNDAGFDVVAVHDRFDPPETRRNGALTPKWQHRDVPPPAESPAQIWIHQRKLLEGIDDSRFRLLAFFDLMRNGREMVQQIGRVLRTGRDDKTYDRQAIVLDHTGGRIERDWRDFLEYDEQLSKETLFEAMSHAYLRKFLAIHPEVEYIDGAFRRRFNLEEFEAVVDEILFKRQVNLLDAGKNFDFAATVEDQIQQLRQDEVIVRKCFDKNNCAVIVSLRQQNPDFLNSTFYSEMRHDVRVIVYLPEEKVVAVADARGAGLGPRLSELRPLKHERLLRALAPSDRGRVASLSSRNTNVSNRVVRSRTVRAASLSKVAPSVDDHGHVLSTVLGWDSTQYQIVDDRADFLDDKDFEFPPPEELIRRRIETLTSANRAKTTPEPELIRRYVSVFTGRISESGPPLRLGHFRAWIQSLVLQMDGTAQNEGEDVFRRFASSAEPPARPLAKNILLDLYDAEEQFNFVVKDASRNGREEKTNLKYNELCLTRTGTKRGKIGVRQAVFRLNMNDTEFELAVTYDPRSSRYRIDSPELDKRVRPSEEESKYIFTRYLNENQNYSILPEDLSTIYVHGEFYAPGIQYGESFDEAKFFAGRSLIPCARLDGLTSEKGRCVLDEKGKVARADGRYYDPESLFAIIDKWSASINSDLDIDLRQGESTTPVMFQSLVQQVSFTPNIVICDDVGRESGDFILANDEIGIVALVHAKAEKTRRPYSASAMQVVCAQAQKNANLYSFFSLRRPANYGSWSRPHKFIGSDGAGSLSIAKRIRVPYGAPKESVWGRIEAMLRNPQTTKEIWIVAGNMLSASAVLSALKSNDPPGEVIQLNHLIETTIASATVLGAKLRIFCMP